MWQQFQRVLSHFHVLALSAVIIPAIDELHTKRFSATEEILKSIWQQKLSSLL